MRPASPTPPASGKTAAVSEELDHKPLRQVVADRIRLMIVAGELAPGQRLIEGQLAERLGVSRNPIREALRSLEATGLIDVIPRKGAHVTSINVDELTQIQDLRYAIESLAAERAAENRTDEDLRALKSCIDQGHLATKQGDKIRAAECHRAFHVALERASKNPYIEYALAPLRQRSELVFAVLQEERGEITWAEHRAILDAVSRRDTKAAGDLMRKHIKVAVEHFSLH